MTVTLLDYIHETDTEEDLSTEDGVGSSSNVAPTNKVDLLDYVHEVDDTQSMLSTEEVIAEEPTFDDALSEEVIPTAKQNDPVGLLDYVHDPDGTSVKYKEPDVNLYNAEFFELDTVQNSISTYLTSRDGKSGARQEGESKEEYAERFFTHMRWLESNLYKTGKGITWLGKADDAANANDLFIYCI